MSNPTEIVRRWVDHGGAWRCFPADSGSIEIALCSCAGETQERVPVDDPDLADELKAFDPATLRTDPLPVP
jgi:hypothetical protein